MIIDGMNLSAFQVERQRRTRRGRGVGSGMGKTAGRGHKGQKARSGGSIRRGFEGGQLPIQQKLPKFGFRSRVSLRTANLPVSVLEQLPATVSEVSFAVLKEHGCLRHDMRRVKIYLSGDVKRAFKVTTHKGQSRTLGLTKGAAALITKAGGEIVETES